MAKYCASALKDVSKDLIETKKCMPLWKGEIYSIELHIQNDLKYVKICGEIKNPEGN